MRLYETFEEVHSEVSRDLKELAVVYQSHNVQDLDVSTDPGYLTHELMNYTYTLAEPISVYDHPDLNWPYINAEFGERTDTVPHNPGNAWIHDEKYWEDFIEPDTGQFAYTYSDRMYRLVDPMIRTLGEDPNSRQAWLPIWVPSDGFDTGSHRVPCSLGYHFLIRNGYLHMNYVMRSCDYVKHFAKDVALAVMLQEYVAAMLFKRYQTQAAMGTFTHTIFSLHAFAKDLEGIF